MCQANFLTYGLSLRFRIFTNRCIEDSEYGLMVRTRRAHRVSSGSVHSVGSGLYFLFFKVFVVFLRIHLNVGLQLARGRGV